MKKIAIPITENNKVEEHFGHSKFYEIYTFSNTNEILDLQLLESEKGYGSKSKIFTFLATNGVTYMLSGSIGNKAKTKLNDAGIDVIRGCSGDSSEAILQFVEGKISDSGASCLKQHQKHRVGHLHPCKY